MLLSSFYCVALVPARELDGRFGMVEIPCRAFSGLAACGTPARKDHLDRITSKTWKLCGDARLQGPSGARRLPLDILN